VHDEYIGPSPTQKHATQLLWWSSAHNLISGIISIQGILIQTKQADIKSSQFKKSTSNYAVKIHSVVYPIFIKLAVFHIVLSVDH
jgi:hypothetical protein